jgi:transcriptional regulator with XRE-family HTH domain
MHAPFTLLRAYRRDKGLSAEEFARDLEIAESTLRSLENGTRPITAEMAVHIEDKTVGGITRQQLRPDLYGSRGPQERAACG